MWLCAKGCDVVDKFRKVNWSSTSSKEKSDIDQAVQLAKEK
jgi:hypothetical protein